MREIRKIEDSIFLARTLIKISIYWDWYDYKKEKRKQANKSLGVWENCWWFLNPLWNRAIIPTLEILHQDDKMNVKCFEVLGERYSINAKWNYYLDITFVTIFKVFLRADILSRYFSETSIMLTNRLENLMGIRYWNTQILYESQLKKYFISNIVFSISAVFNITEFYDGSYIPFKY